MRSLELVNMARNQAVTPRYAVQEKEEYFAMPRTHELEDQEMNYNPHNESKATLSICLLMNGLLHIEDINLKSDGPSLTDALCDSSSHQHERI